MYSFQHKVRSFVRTKKIESQSAIMSDFPKGGDVATTREWLDKKGFKEILVGWKADAILGLDRTDILASVPGENGLKLCGFLNTARQTTGMRKYTVIHSHA